MTPPRGFPVIEIFGPTIQGEGPQAGLPALFVRFGGCDYACAWCDSMHAVDPVDVRKNAVYMTEPQICNALAKVMAEKCLVVLTGGNPALHDLGQLVDDLHAIGFTVAIETQGSLWRPWMEKLDQLVISPKPPSAGMMGAKHERDLMGFMGSAVAHWSKGGEVASKIVVFHEEDLQWAIDFFNATPGIDQFLSVGTPVGMPESEAVDQVLARFRWLCDRVKAEPALVHARVLPQLHVLAWGLAQGV